MTQQHAHGVQPARQLYECAECSQPDCTWRGECDGESCPACGGNVVPVGDGVRAAHTTNTGNPIDFPDESREDHRG